jgi:hypothetical protein
MDLEKLIVWAEGDTQNAIELRCDPMGPLDVEAAADALGCEIDQVNFCAPGEMDAYGVSLKTDIFQRPRLA